MYKLKYKKGKPEGEQRPKRRKEERPFASGYESFVLKSNSRRASCTHLFILKNSNSISPATIIIIYSADIRAQWTFDSRGHAGLSNFARI